MRTARWGPGNAGRAPACHSRMISSSRPNRRTRHAMIMACSAAGIQNGTDSDSNPARRVPTRSARVEG